MRKLLLVGVAVVVLAGCGGGGGSKQSAAPGSASPGGATVTPTSSTFLLRLDTAFDSDQWTAFDALLKKFPDGEKLYSSLGGSGVDFENDVKPALGPETDVVALTADDLNKSTFVGLTQPDDQAKLDTLLTKAKPPKVSERIDSWTAVANDRATIDRFKQARNEGALADSTAFKDANAGLPGDALATLYMDGAGLTTQVNQRVKTGTTVPGVGKIAWLSGALSAKENGVALDLRLKGDQVTASSYKPELPSQVPAGVSLFVDFKGLDTALQQAIQSPALKQQLGSAGQALGATLGNIIGLFKGEGAFYVRPVSGKQEYTLALSVSDEQAARSALDQLATLVGAFTQSTPQAVTIAGVDAKKITLGKTAVYYAVFDGKVVLTSAESGIQGLKDGSQRLADSQAWTDAATSADLPDSVAGIFFGDVQALVPLVQSLSGTLGSLGGGSGSGSGSSQISPQVMRNLAPLGAALVFGSVDGDVLALKGFVSVR